MIVPMKKYSFLVYHQDYFSFLEKIRELGILHVVEKNQGLIEDEFVRKNLELSKRFQASITFFRKKLEKEVLLPTKKDKNPIDLLQEYEKMQQEKAFFAQQIQSTQKEIDRMQVWGHFDWEQIKRFDKTDYNIRFYVSSKRNFDEQWLELYNAIEIESLGSNVYFITFTPKDLSFDIHADLLVLPELSLDELQQQKSDFIDKIDDLNQRIFDFGKQHLTDFEEHLLVLQNEFQFSSVKFHTSSAVENKLMLLEGFVPEENEKVFLEFLHQSTAFYQSEKPLETDKVPILLKNNRFSKLYEMIGELYDMPNYHEMDLTPFFAPFYMLFFGLCLGDAGYGLFLVLLALLVRPRVKESLKPIFSLVIYLGSATVVLGFLSGTFFGINLIEADIPWLNSYKKLMLDSNQLFYFSLIIGVVQILFGMILKAINKVRRYGWAASFSTWGWLFLIVGCGIVYGLQTKEIISLDISQKMYYVVGGIAAIFIFLLNNIKRNVFINIGAGLWDSYNMITGFLGDVLSYIRLFALGISGAVMGFVFNDLALNLSGDVPVLSHLVMLFILLFGHGINIFMAGLSAFVHPMRLTFVEFYKNAGFEGGGKKYNPFKLKVKS